uniref:Uncharacterized protein n=1 Tax=Cacopsylla melanoneura TaxID=428564 RepID=A0A8D8LZE3_9HEMI
MIIVISPVACVHTGPFPTGGKNPTQSSCCCSSYFFFPKVLLKEFFHPPNAVLFFSLFFNLSGQNVRLVIQRARGRNPAQGREFFLNMPLDISIKSLFLLL